MYNVHGPKFEIYVLKRLHFIHRPQLFNWVVQNPMFLKFEISMPQIFQKITQFGFDRLEFPLQFVIRARNQYVCVKLVIQTEMIL